MDKDSKNNNNKDLEDILIQKLKRIVKALLI